MKQATGKRKITIPNVHQFQQNLQALGTPKETNDTDLSSKKTKNELDQRKSRQIYITLLKDKNTG